jgi:hypothetical protein
VIKAVPVRSGRGLGELVGGVDRPCGGGGGSSSGTGPGFDAVTGWEVPGGPPLVGTHKAAGAVAAQR